MSTHQLGLDEQNNYKGKTGKVLTHLQSHGSITSWTAIQLYRATRLSAIIFNLREDGYHIRSERKTEDGTTFAVYHYEGK